MAHPTVNVTKLDCAPNMCDLNEPLTIDMEYDTDKPLKRAFWEIKYIVDHTGKRLQINLGCTDTAPLDAGQHKLHYTVPGLGIDDIDRSMLTNVGLLQVVLRDVSNEEDEVIIEDGSGSDALVDEIVGTEVIQIALVTQVIIAKDKSLQRMIFNPLE